MMLPEHVAEIRRHRAELEKKERPTLDEQQVSLISEAIQASLIDGTDITIKVFDMFEDRYITGRVERVDQQLRQIKLAYDGDYEWIKLSDMIGVVE
ncbi:hypothetical protein J31TS4_19000 [Paenibacillus sp. J31TS4]|nr:hypothetical protein J31TS4_19000 [Paenibacillus sp. J31TS4]